VTTTASADAATGLSATGLFTDHYELTMLDSLVGAGRAQVPAVFEAHARQLPQTVGFGVVWGVGRLAELLERFRFDEADIAALEADRVVSDATLEFLRDFRFSGEIDAYADGSLWFAHSPLLTVRASLGEGLLIETLALSVLNHGCAVATHAAAMRQGAGDATLIEMGSRRVHEEAAVQGAVAAWVGGFDLTSNLAARRRYGVPSGGTASHAFSLAFEDEAAAFDAQLDTHGAATTLLVDTFNTTQGIEAAVDAARRAGADGPGAVRIDSGEALEAAAQARAQLDALGATATRIVVSGDLRLDDLRRATSQGAPIDAFGIGTHIAMAPSVGIVYKLAAVGDPEPVSDSVSDSDLSTPVPLRQVAKSVPGRLDHPGEKFAYRRVRSGVAEAEVVASRPIDAPDHQPLQVAAFRDRRAAVVADAGAARDRRIGQQQALGTPAAPGAALPTIVV
jgi:nicotinate phosphoribosyltransferase